MKYFFFCKHHEIFVYSCLSLTFLWFFSAFLMKEFCYLFKMDLQFAVYWKNPMHHFMKNSNFSYILTLNVFCEINCMQFKAFNFTLLCSFSRFFFTWIPISYHDFLLKWSCILKIIMSSRSHYKSCYSLCLQMITRIITIFRFSFHWWKLIIHLFLTAVKNLVIWCKNIL